MDAELNHLRHVKMFDRDLLVREEYSDLQVARFLNHVVFDPSGCWLWTGYINPNGYGCAHSNGETRLAHRLAYAIFIGPVSSEHDLHHRTESPFNCLGPRCVNPEHLLPLTPRVHALEYTPNNILAIRNGATTCVQGHELNEENSYVYPGTTKRRCRICNREWARRVYALKHANTEKTERTHCGNGHLLDDGNTYEYKGARHCRICHAGLTLRRYHEKRAARYGSKAEQLRAAADAHTERMRAKRTNAEGVLCCKNGHLMIGDNIYTYRKAGQPQTACKTCKDISNKASYEARKAKYAAASSDL